MDTIWKIYGKKADFDGIAQKFNIDMVIARLLRNRDVCGDENIEKYLHGGSNSLYKPKLLYDSEKLVKILKEKIKSGCKIRIVGDYDTDGVCAVVILYSVIKMFGGCVDYRIPHRIFDGYGINERIVCEAVEEKIDTIITCDNGIAAINPMELAKKNNITVLITDHHKPYNDGQKEILPMADALVNPHRESCKYPYKEICGAVVACKIAELLVQEFGGEENHYVDKEKLDVWKHRIYELSAIATVADVMPLADENRIIVKYGLELLHNSQITGIRALAKELNIDIKNIGSYHIGFQLAPCLNAGGRLQTALTAIELLLEQNEEKAGQLARNLYELNMERKELTEQWSRQAIQMAQNEYRDDKVLVLYLPDCHESIAGIIAGRVREAVYRPVFVITNASNGLKGSGRSIEGYDMFGALLKCKDLLDNFGGHVMAAGLSLCSQNLPELRKRLNLDCMLTQKQMTPVRWIDMEMPMSYVTFELVEQLKLLEPFGNGNPKPLFAQKNLHVCSAYKTGSLGDILKLRLSDSHGNRFSCVKFRCNDEAVPVQGDTIKCVYYPSINEYNERTFIQYVIEEIL